jgi:hypothetical protein
VPEVAETAVRADNAQMLTLRKGSLLVLALACLLAPLAVAAPAQAVPWGANLTITQFDGTLGDDLRFSGYVVPSAAGKTIKIQEARLGTNDYRTVKTVKLSVNSRFITWYTPTAPGRFKYRIVKDAGGGRSTGYSTARTVDVYRWHWLADLDTTASSGVVETGVGVVRYQVFYHSISLAPAASVTYRLPRPCRDLEFLVGTWTGDLHATVTARNHDDTVVVPVDLDLKGGQYPYRVTGNNADGTSWIEPASTLTFTAGPTDGTPNAKVVFGDARVMCAA